MSAKVLETEAGRYKYVVAWYELRDGRKVRKRAYYNDKRKAQLKANKVSSSTWAQGAEALTLTHAEKAAVLTWRDTAEKVGALPSLYDVVKAQAEKFKAESSKTLTEAILSAVAKRKTEGRSARTVKELETHGERLTAAFGEGCLLSAVSTPDVDDWLDMLLQPKDDGGFGLSGTTAANHRRSAHTIFAEAIRQKWIAENPVAAALMPEKGAPAIHILQPEEAQKLLNAAAGSPFLLPMALQMFAGLRTSEVVELKWDSIDRAAEVVKDMTSKTRKRIIPFLGCLGDLIEAEPEKEAGAPVVEVSGWHYSHQIHKLFRAAGVKKEVNILRHSFCSYRVADCKSLDQTALEAANSPAVIREHYWRLVTDAQARKYFAAKAP